MKILAREALLKRILTKPLSTYSRMYFTSCYLRFGGIGIAKIHPDQIIKFNLLVSLNNQIALFGDP